MPMPLDYLTKNEFREFLVTFDRRLLDLKEELKVYMLEQRKEFELYTGALAEHFEEKLAVVAEGIQMNLEKTDRLKVYVEKEIDTIDKRFSPLELSQGRKRIKALAAVDRLEKKMNKRKRKPRGI